MLRRTEAARQCHTVTEQVSGAHHHVPDVDPDAEANAAIRRKSGVRLGESSLRLHRALYGVNGTLSPAVFVMRPLCSPNEPVEDRPPFGQAFERPNFVRAHEAAVALHICCEDRDELPADCHRV